ncbi:MAG TPA: ATP-binding protein [Chitinophagaceae bacterium]|nr:ATP-binding protein [Chitinophagaceae bacterium]
MILIVDDRKENLFSLKTLLQLNGYETDTAGSGEEALKKILKTEYALLILDVQMPGMDGYEVAEAVTSYSKTKNIPIIFLSAVNIDKRFITKGYASGGVDYVTKPFDADLLLLKVKTFYRIYEQNRELTRMHTALKDEVEMRKEAQKALEDINLLLEEKVKERTRELLKTNRELEISNTELAQYASLASHDLQEPVRKIMIFSQLLGEKFLSDKPEAISYLKKITASSERMRALINDLLNYSALSGHPHFVQTDLNAVLQDAVHDLEITISEKNAEVSIGKLPCIEAITGQIRQMFQNLLSNALKFAGEGSPPAIGVWGELIAERSIDAPAIPTGEYLRIFVRDNGIGFDEMYIDKIFTIFQRLHSRNEYEGTGIGLAIVKKIIEKHNGLISAKSKEGQGTTFIIVLPVRQTNIS